MGYVNHGSELRALSASEGVFTAAQAERLGIPRNALSVAVRAGRAERVARGAYRLTGTASRPTDELAAIWKLTKPSTFTGERMAAWDGMVVGGTSAANLLGIGDFCLSPYRLYTPRRFNTRNDTARFTVRRIDSDDITWIDGLPVTRMERTLVDLCLDDEDPSLVEDAFHDATDGGMNPHHLQEIIRTQAHDAQRHGALGLLADLVGRTVGKEAAIHAI